MKIKIVALSVCILIMGVSFAQNNDYKKQIIGKWEITKTEFPEAQKEYDEWIQKLKSAKDENEKEMLNNKVRLYEWTAKALIGKVTEYKLDSTFTVEIPQFFSSSSDIATGKWTLSSDNKKITIEIEGKVTKEGNTTRTVSARKSECEIVTLGNRELVYRTGEGKQEVFFYLVKK